MYNSGPLQWHRYPCASASPEISYAIFYVIFVTHFVHAIPVLKIVHAALKVLLRRAK